jgi:hypothetical protein
MKGDQKDMFARLKERVPRGWFGDVHPLLDAVFQGIAWALAGVYSLYAYMVLQTRIQTSTDGWLDMSAVDHFGPTGLLRLTNESDPVYRNRILVNIIRERGTRNAVIKVLTDLTGRAPTIVEPMRPLDTGAYGAPNIGYGVAGAYGSMLLNYQAFVTAYRPIGTGIPLVSGYGTSSGGYATPSRSDYASIGDVINAVSDAAIYAAVASVIPVATIAWMRISS